MVDLLGCAGHQQNAEIAGKITIMRESFVQQANIKRIKSESSQAPSRIWLLEIPCTFKEDTPCNMTSVLQECACTYRMK
jgi:hypothetical protein